MLSTMTNGISTRLKVNGVLGERIDQCSGVRQGCPCSSLIYLFVMEVVLTMIRENPDITGMEIPNEHGPVRAERGRAALYARDHWRTTSRATFRT
jgi:hypothetical protein